MTDPVQLPAQERVYGSFASMLRKYDRYARQDAFRGSTPEEFRQWREDTRSLLHSLLGTCKMERDIQDARRMETVFTEEGIRREHWRIQVEPEVWMTLFLLAPVGAGKDTPVILCPPGHNGAGSTRSPVCGTTRPLPKRSTTTITITVCSWQNRAV